MKLLELTNQAFQDYRQTVRGNQKISFDQAQRKLTRNVKLAAEQKSFINTLKRQKVYIYGQLRMVVKNDTIIKIENDEKYAIKGWVKDEDEYTYLSKLLRIKDYKIANVKGKKKSS